MGRLKSKNGKGFPEEGEVGAEGLWFRRAQLEAKKRVEPIFCTKKCYENSKNIDCVHIVQRHFSLLLYIHCLTRIFLWFRLKTYFLSFFFQSP